MSVAKRDAIAHGTSVTRVQSHGLLCAVGLADTGMVILMATCLSN